MGNQIKDEKTQGFNHKEMIDIIRNLGLTKWIKFGFEAKNQENKGGSLLEGNPSVVSRMEDSKKFDVRKIHKTERAFEVQRTEKYEQSYKPKNKSASTDHSNKA